MSYNYNNGNPIDDDDDMLGEYDFSEGKPNPYIEDKTEQDIAYWDFRIFKGEDEFLTVGEVFYDNKGNPIGWQETAMSPGGENIEELINCLNKMFDALKKPIFTPPKD